MRSGQACRNPSGLPPGPALHPLLQTYRFITRPQALLGECHKALGDIFTLNLVGLGNWVLLSAPEHIKTLFSASPEVLHAGEANESVFGPILGRSSLVTLDEEAHLERRRLLAPSLHGDAIKRYVEDIAEIAETMVDSWPVGKAFSIHKAAQQISMRVILKVVFGIDETADTRNFGRLIRDLANFAATPLVFIPRLQRDLGRYSPWGRVMHAVRLADDALYAEIARRRSTPHPTKYDICSLLLSARGDDGTCLTDSSLRDELITLLLAGHETTATALAWTFERILSVPHVYEKVRSELADRLPHGRIRSEDVQKLRYIDAVINETHRFCPIMPVGGSRKVKYSFEIGGFVIPPGTIVTNCMYLLHRRPDIYPNPDSFEPERFLEKRPEPFELTPFGGGIRRCLGMVFATLEMKIVLATVLSRTRLKIENPDAKTLRRGFFLAPHRGPSVFVGGRE